MSWYGSPGQQLYFEDTGRGDPVLLLPGWAGSVVELAGVRRELASGFRVIAADLPGSGRSQPQPRRYTPAYYLDDAGLLLSLLDELDIDAAHLVGFSDGGEEALLMAALEPGRALSVVAWGAAGQVRAAPGMLDRLARVVDDPTEPLITPAAYLAEAYGVDQARIMTASWARALGGIVAAGGDISRARAGSITCPALLITGSEDPFCPPNLVREMSDAIPRGEYREVPGAGHEVHRLPGGRLAHVIGDWLGNH